MPAAGLKITMNEKPAGKEYVLDVLKERAKELNCLYLVEELLSRRKLSLSEIFGRIVNIIPSGLRFPDVCKARLVYEKNSYQTTGFRSSSWMFSSDIKIEEKAVGKVEVCYLSNVPRTEEGVFLEREQKLIKTIAGRIGQTVLHRKMDQILKEWDSAKKELSETEDTSREWKIIVDLLNRTDQGMLLHICRKMINYLFWSGVEEAAGVLHKIGSKSIESFESGEVNAPSLRKPLEDIVIISEKTFKIASKHLSDSEIVLRVKKWIQEEKYNFLIRTVDRVDASLSEIIDALSRYRNIFENQSISYSPTERWLKVALIHRFLSNDLDFINIAKQYIEVQDFCRIADKMIYPPGSKGKLGGKSTGLFFGQQILDKTAAQFPILKSVKTPKTWYITADEMTEFLHHNNLEELKEQKYKELYEIRIDYPNIIQLMKNASFTPGIIKSLALALDDFGERPLIVRSSSLLEDRMGAAFSGKYKSLFLSNQGSKQQRLEALTDAIIEVYSSKFCPDSIQYRSERGLLDFPEEMGIMIQEVVGTQIGDYYMPLYAGIAFSSNEFRWSPRIRREDGLLRIVPGLGTRAVDRLSDDFPVLISPGQPELRTNTVPEEIKHYSPGKIDLINLKTNSFETVDVRAFIRKHGDEIPEIHNLVSIYRDNQILKPSKLNIDFENDDLVVTFDGLISKTPLVKLVSRILKTLQEKMGTPIDIEFASDGKDFYLLQCRAQSSGAASSAAPIPKDITDSDMLFTAKKYISNGRIDNISHIVYVDPDAYNKISRKEEYVNTGKIVGLLNSILPKRQFILMGPGRWGSRGDIRLGVPVSYSDINNTAALIEIARKKSGYVPELSFGTHFFQDLVEADIRYLPLYPDEKDIVFNEMFFSGRENILEKVLPDYASYSDIVKVIDVPKTSRGKILKILMNADLSEAVGFLGSPSAAVPGRQEPEDYGEPKIKDEFWRWRYHMAKCIASRIDPKRFGVQGFYVFGSTNNTTAGPASDIDILIHFRGNKSQRKDLEQWLEGWSICLAELNYLKTGYSAKELLDLHIVTDEDIKNKTSYAVKIGAVTDPAHPLELKKDSEK